MCAGSNEETKRADLLLEADDVGVSFPELMSEAGDGGKAVNVAGLCAPFIEAIRELEARVSKLEAKFAAVLISRWRG